MPENRSMVKVAKELLLDKLLWRLTCPLALILAVVWLAIASGIWVSEAGHRWRGGVEIEARVVDAYNRSRFRFGATQTYRVVHYRYEVDGVEYEGQAEASWGDWPGRSEQVPILYRPSDPGKSIPAGWSYGSAAAPWYFWCAMLGLFWRPIAWLINKTGVITISSPRR